jgi:putative Mg2+ transporter-C (MgtC) family protein
VGEIDLEAILDDLIGTVPDFHQLLRVTMRLLAALTVGAIIGYQRERVGKAAGLRTHILVCMGTALFVISCVEYGFGSDALSRVIQGLATGIGFLGGGVILKLRQSHQIRGLTTAAGVLMTCAAGVAVGLGQVILAFIGAILAWIVLSFFVKVEQRAGLPNRNSA